jgi:hypothetical protein
VLPWVLLGLQAGRVAEGPPSLYRLIPGCCGASREQSREHRGFGPVRSRTPSALRSSATRDRIGRPGTARPSLPATYVVRGAFGVPWASDSANLVTHSLQMKISVSLAKSWGSLTGYSAPKSVCTCWWDFLQNQHLNWTGSGQGLGKVRVGTVQGCTKGLAADAGSWRTRGMPGGSQVVGGPTRIGGMTNGRLAHGRCGLLCTLGCTLDRGGAGVRSSVRPGGGRCAPPGARRPPGCPSSTAGMR